MSAVGERFAGILDFGKRSFDASGLSRFKIGDTLFAKITPCPQNGKVAFVRDLPAEIGLGSTEFIVLSPRPETDARFLYHLLCSHEVRGHAAARMEGSTGRQRVPDDVFEKWLIVPIPDRAEQTAIAEVLDAVDLTLERTWAATDHGHQLDHSLLHALLEGEMRGRYGSGSYASTGWPIRRVDEVADVGSGLTLGKDVSGVKSVELPYLRVANVQDGHLDLSNIKTVRVAADAVADYRLEVGDVLMTEGGDIDKLGRGTIWRGEVPECLHQNHIFRIRAKKKLLDPEFYGLVVESDIAKRYFSRVAKRTTNLASTNKTQVRAFRFPIPPTLEEQREVVDVMTACKATVAALTRKQVALDSLKKSLMTELLSGRVRVRDLSMVSL